MSVSREARAAIEPVKDYLTRDAESVCADLDSFTALLQKWSRVKNLVSRETLAETWPRHIVDSLQLLPLIGLKDRVFLDLGSGGGFPALPLAIALKHSDRRFILVESNGRKCAFLKAVGRELALDLDVHAERIEALQPGQIGPVDVVTSRALSSLNLLLGFSAPFWGETTRALFHKGREHVEDVAESRARWHYDVVTHQSWTDAAAAVLEISNLAPISV